MSWRDALGAAATLAALALPGWIGALLAERWLGRERCQRDALAFAVAALALTLAQSIAVALLLGVVGWLRIDVALGVEALLAFVLTVSRPLPAAGGSADRSLPRRLAERSVDRVREHPFLTLLAVHAVAVEALTGLLRPPLSWDSLMYHLLLTATWLQDRALSVVYGMFPVSYYGYVPANGSLWLWWWMAPSHSELYVNLAMVPVWLLLGLATAGVARELGARRTWPLAAFLVLLSPLVIRFVATQYVDILLAAALMTAAFFGAAWLAAPEPDWGGAAIAGVGLGLAAGTKVLGPPYALALGLALALGSRGRWRLRTRQLAVAAALALLLGSYFYLRNVHAGAGLLAMSCAPTSGSPGARTGLRFPLPLSLAANFGTLWRSGALLDSFIGYTDPSSLELGLGPQAVLLLAGLVLPWWFAAGKRRLALVVWSQILVELSIWLTVPEATGGHLFTNVRYLIAAVGLVVAGLLAAAERRGLPERGILAVAALLLVQDLLMLHTVMPREVRLVVATVDLVAAVLFLLPAARVWTRAHLRPLFAFAAAAAVLIGAPALARFRAVDRSRALATEYSAHDTRAKALAHAWGWLDRHGGEGTVAVATMPGDFFVYPAMGMRLERRVVYANINRADYRSAVRYLGCNPRVDADPDAWLANLERLKVRWLLLGRFTLRPGPIEARWVRERPQRFAIRYSDEWVWVVELLPSP